MYIDLPSHLRIVIFRGEPPVLCVQPQSATARASVQRGLLCIGSTWQMWYRNRAQFMVLPVTCSTISKLAKNIYTKNHHTTCPPLELAIDLQKPTVGPHFLSTFCVKISSICQCLARMKILRFRRSNAWLVPMELFEFTRASATHNFGTRSCLILGPHLNPVA